MTEIVQFKYPATVVSIIDIYKVVINRGAKNGIKEGQRFLLYKLGEKEIKDITGESLGYLEMPKGTGRVISVQERISIIESDRMEQSEKTIVRKTRSLFAPESEETTIPSTNRMKPFDAPVIGDKAKPI